MDRSSREVEGGEVVELCGGGAMTLQSVKLASRPGTIDYFLVCLISMDINLGSFYQ